MQSVSRKAALAIAASLATAAFGSTRALAQATVTGSPVSGQLFYTTFAAPDLTNFTFGTATVDSVNFSYAGGNTLQFTNQTTLASLPQGQNADGIIFDNSGNLLVGSAGINVSIPLLGVNVTGTNQIVRYTQAGAKTGSATTSDGPFHLTLSPDGKTVYSGGTFGTVTEPIVGPLPIDGDSPGHLVSTPSDLSAAGTNVSTSGADNAFTQLAFTPGGKVFYTASTDAGTGNYGFIDLSTGATTQLGTGLAAAHGVLYDPFSNTVIMTGGTEIAQLDPVTGAIIGTRTIGTQLDQGSTDGHGHLFVGDNNGDIAFIDFSATKDISSNSDVAFEQFVQTSLDDLAPLNAIGAPPVTIPIGPPPPPPPPPGVPLPPAGWMGLAMLASMLGVSKIRSSLLLRKA